MNSEQFIWFNRLKKHYDADRYKNNWKSDYIQTTGGLWAHSNILTRRHPITYLQVLLIQWHFQKLQGLSYIMCQGPVSKDILHHGSKITGTLPHNTLVSMFKRNKEASSMQLWWNNGPFVYIISWPSTLVWMNIAGKKTKQNNSVSHE